MNLTFCVYIERAILYGVKSSNVSIIVGHASTEKSTLVPILLHDANIAASKQILNVSSEVQKTSDRIAHGIGERVGQTIGCSVPFQDQTSYLTRVKCVTPEMLIWEAMIDPLLRKYNAVILNDVHFRLAWMDVVIGIMLKVLLVRKELKIILMLGDSMFVEELLKYLKKSSVNPIVIPIDFQSVSPVDVLYSTEPIADYVQSAATTLLKLHSREPAGDVIVFLTSIQEGLRLSELVSSNSAGGSGIRLAIYSSEMSRHRREVFQQFEYEDEEEDSRRVIVISSEMAEDELYDLVKRFSRLRYVIDSGFVRRTWFDSTTKTYTTAATPISKHAAEQRRLLAGMNQIGHCYRLYTKEAAVSLLPSSVVPQIEGIELSEIILRLKALGIDNIIRSFPFITPPDVDSVASSVESLYALGAIDDSGKLTREGEIMAELPVFVRFAKCITTAGKLGCLDEMISIIACLMAGSLDSIFYFPSQWDEKQEAELQHERFMVKEGDFLTLLNIFRGFIKSKKKSKWARDCYLNHQTLLKANQIYQQLTTFAIKLQIATPNTSLDNSNNSLSDRINRCLVKGFFNLAAKKRGEFYDLIGSDKGLMVKAVSGSIVHKTRSIIDKNPWVIYDQIVEGDDGQLYITNVNVVSRQLLEETGFYRTIEPK